MEILIDGIEGHVTRAIAIAGVLALLIVGAVWFVWLRGRRMVERGRTSLAAGRHLSLTSRMDEPPPASGSPGATGPRDAAQGEDPLASKLVREAAVRAAALRDSWDRSYREARGSGASPGGSAPGGDLQTALEELLREQRETNSLLRQLLERLASQQR